MNKEIWKDVIGYEGLYQVSNHGRIKSLERKVSWRNTYRTIKERILKQRINNNGYYIITLHKKCNLKTFTIHRLVAIHFISNPENKSQVNHIDGDKSNNNVNNLEWCTSKDNINHAWKTGLNENARKFSYQLAKKYRSKKVMCIETGIVYESGYEAERQTNIAHQSISHCCNGKYKWSGKKVINGKLTKLTWKYV